MLYLTPSPPKTIQGFTLVELSIVIIIIGLIIAGVTAGKSLVRQAQLNRIITDVANFRVAYNAFKLQYNTVPGDLPNAYSYWSNAWATCTNTDANTGAHDGCNGNGNRHLEFANEGTLIWKHMQLAGLIQGQYTGLNPATGPLSQSVYYAIYDSYYAITNTRDMFSFGLNGGAWWSGAILTPSEAFSIDKKSDDGDPIRGKTFSGTSVHNPIGTCINGSSSENLTNATAYSLSNTDIACRMLFLF